MDNKSLRKLNFRKNKADPILPSESKGGLGDRDINTGRYGTNLDNGGTYSAKRLFQASTSRNQHVQLNEATRTANYKSNESDVKKAKGGIPSSRTVRPATAVWEIEPNDTGENDTDNPFFGNCNVCQGNVGSQINSNSGKTRITFSDGSTEEIQTPAELEYGAKAKFTRTDGSNGELYANTCASLSVFEGTEDPSDATSDQVYGQLIYSQKARAFSVGDISETDIKEFQFYQDNCTVSIVAIAQNNTRQLIGITTCENLSGAYTPIVDSICVALNNKKACGVIPESIQTFCIIRGYRLCQKHQIKWTELSSGKEVVFEDCEQIGYQIVSEPQDRQYKPSGQQGTSSMLRYDSGIPRKFTVTAGIDSFGSGEYGYFQIYQNPETPCEYQIKGVKVTGAASVFSGAVTTKEYATVYTGACGFKITLGDYLADQFLRIFDEKDNLLIETSDFIPSSVLGSQYLGNGQFTLDPLRSAEIERVEAFEKESPSNVEGFGILSIECI